VRRGESWRFWEALPLIGSGPSPSPARTFFGTTSAGDAAMANDYMKIPRRALARANAISERTIFWGMIFTVLVAIAGMTRGMLGQLIA
jgi:hypothetical protein